MLIVDSPADRHRLEQDILSDRKKIVRDVIPTVGPPLAGAEQNVIELPLRNPGRPRREAHG